MHNYLARAKAKQSEGGFTLIELLVVIVILGILAAVVVFSVGGITDRGSASACKSTMEQVNTANEAYRAQNGTYPANWGQLNDFLNIAASQVNSGADGAAVADTSTTVRFQDRATTAASTWQVQAVMVAQTGNGTPAVVTALKPSASCNAS